jgi:mRNA interferase MazF
MPSELRCAASPAHMDFVGTQHLACEYVVELDVSGNVTNSTHDSTLEELSNYRDHVVYCATCGAEARPGRSSISFLPSAGMVLLGDFSVGFKKPEIIKIRPVIVLSDRKRNRDTCVVVPLGSKPPTDSKAIFVPLDLDKYPFLQGQSYAKCDVVNSVRLARLSRLRDKLTGRGMDSRSTQIDAADLANIRIGVSTAIGLP